MNLLKKRASRVSIYVLNNNTVIQNKTAIQVFQEWVKSFPYVLNQSDIDQKITELLAIERQQIITAHREGQEFSLIEGLPDSEDYYLKTYVGEPEFPKDRDTGNRDTV